MKDTRIVFMGTSDFAKEILNNLLVNNFNVVLVVSQPDSIVGRKKILTPSPVKTFALNNNLEVFTPDNIKKDMDAIKKSKPDIIITCAYGQIIPKELLDLPSLGCINVHASLLPKLRGGAPIHRAIMEGHKKTGITIMYMDEHMDTGDIIEKSEVEISLDDDLESLSKKLVLSANHLLIDTLPKIISGSSSRTKQNDNDATYAKIITKDDEFIDFNRTSQEIYNQIRALNPNPGAYFLLNKEVVKVYRSSIGNKKSTPGMISATYKDGIGIGTSDGEIIIKTIKLSGKNKVEVKDYLNGVKKEKLIGVMCNEK